VANIILLIVFIHQIAVSIQADKVISDISAFISRQVRVLFPEKMGEEIDSEKELPVERIKAEYKHAISIKCNSSGYLQYIDSGSLLDAVTDYNALIELKYRPGDYLVEGIEIGEFYTNDEAAKDAIPEILSHFVIGKTKTAQQDLEFSIHQMVEIAVRALSPGVNDPYTAMTCIDNLTSAMSYLAQVSFPSKYRVDKKMQLRIIADTLDFEGVLDAAFNQIRQYSAGNTAVIIRLMESLITIHEFVKKENYKKAVIKHARMTLHVGRESIKEKNDLEDLASRSRKILGE
ncbi:MAG: DUF2254 domain-containing protein, partial [Clostridia bacterium]|nr:DUF2254 domain-containing protein [Clostridia bacterium]